MKNYLVDGVEMETRKKITIFEGRRRDGSALKIARSGWKTARGPVLAQMERGGCIGDVEVRFLAAYGDQKFTVRTIECAI